MSAFMHSPAHVDAILAGVMRRASWGVRWAAPQNPTLYKELRVDDYGTATDVGRMLLRENAESMAYRYDMKNPDNPADGGTRPIEYLGYLDTADHYVYSRHDTGKPWRMLPVVAVLQAIDSLEYQSCEHPEWRDSEARAFLGAARGVLIPCLPGYDDADAWSIEGNAPDMREEMEDAKR